MPTTVHLSDLESLVGQHVGTSEWLTVTQEMIDLFADATLDHQWIHVDRDKAAQGPFGTTIAHGYMTLALIPHLAPQALKVEGIGMGVNYGLNRCRFPSPVPSGARVRADVTVKEVTPLDGGATQVVNEVVISVEGAAKPACVAETVVRYYPG